MVRSDNTSSNSDAGSGTESAGTAGGEANAGPSLTASLPSLNRFGDPKRLLWLGGLVAVGALGLLEWPVVAAVGVGSYVTEQLTKSDLRPIQH